jgi:hypothetical protein
LGGFVFWSSGVLLTDRSLTSRSHVAFGLLRNDDLGLGHRTSFGSSGVALLTRLAGEHGDDGDEHGDADGDAHDDASADAIGF